MKHAIAGLLCLVSLGAQAATTGVPVKDQYAAVALFDCYAFWQGGVYYALNIKTPADAHWADLIDQAIANGWSVTVKVRADAAPFDQQFYAESTPCGANMTIVAHPRPINVTVNRTPNAPAP